MPVKIPADLCVKCKGYKRLCGLPRCPILERFQSQVNALSRIKGKEIEGATPPSALVGEFGYPKVNVYFMVPPGKRGNRAKYYDDPHGWILNRESITGIIELRSSMISAILNSPVNNPWVLYEKEISLAMLSLKPVDSEVTLRRPPVPSLKFDGITRPIGPSGPVERIRISDNPQLHEKLEKVIWDDIKAEEAIKSLYLSGMDVYEIQRAMSLGTLGSLKRRRLVPTRWAITAVDEVLSRFMKKKTRERKWINEIEVRYGEYIGNRYIIVLFPGPGNFEWLELWQPRGLWTKSVNKPIIWRVFEDNLGGISAVDGGFSAAKIAILEHLFKRKRSADVLIIREILPTYYAPVGNWHIRETVREIMAKEPIKVMEINEIRRFVNKFVDVDLNELSKRSIFLRGIKQTRLSDYEDLG